MRYINWHLHYIYNENWTVRAFLQLTPRLSNDFTAAWLTFTFPQLFAVAATLKSIDYNVATTFILNNNNNNNNNNNASARTPNLFSASRDLCLFIVDL